MQQSARLLGTTGVGRRLGVVDGALGAFSLLAEGSSGRHGNARERPRRFTRRGC